MVEKKQIAITIGAMCTILTVAIIVQLNTIKAATEIVGTTYAESRLKEEVLKWKSNYENLYNELERTGKELENVRQEVTQENTRGTELEEELSEINKKLGLTELTGKGIIVTLADRDSTTNALVDSTLVENISDYLIHDGDLIETVNELFNAGAEAISINGQRIVSTSSITCIGAVVTINGVKLNSPFEIKAIGSPESLYGITRKGGIIENIARKRSNYKN